MTALDQLERSLARAVENGAAAAPAPARLATDASEATSAKRSRQRGLRRLRPRRGWHVFVTILVAGGVTTGALAATGQLKIVSSTDKNADLNYRVMSFPGYYSKATEEPTLLPMRVKDPKGGPDWALRTFPIGRGKVCGQAGQVYEGKFGIVTEVRDPSRNEKGDNSGPAWGMTVFQELAPSLGMQGVRCGAARAGDVLNTGFGQTIVDGVEGADLRCGNNPAPAEADCRITGVRAIRWGFLGPKAKTATFVHPGAGGRRGPTQQLDPTADGAYLFVESIDPGPFRASRDFEIELRKKIDEKYPRIPYGSIPKVQRPAADRRWRERNAYVGEVYRAARKDRRGQWRAQQPGAVDATFDGAPDRRVLARGPKAARCPECRPSTRPRRNCLRPVRPRSGSPSAGSTARRRCGSSRPSHWTIGLGTTSSR